MSKKIDKILYWPQRKIRAKMRNISRKNFQEKSRKKVGGGKRKKIEKTETLPKIEKQTEKKIVFVPPYNMPKCKYTLWALIW